MVRAGWAILLAAMMGVGGCTLTAEEQAGLLEAFAEGLAQSTPGYYGPGYGGYGGYDSFGGVPGTSVRLCAARGNARGRVVYGLVRSGAALDRAAGPGVFDPNSNYITLPSAYGTAIVAVPAWASLARGPVYGIDQSGYQWRLAPPYGCY